MPVVHCSGMQSQPSELIKVCPQELPLARLLGPLRVCVAFRETLDVKLEWPEGVSPNSCHLQNALLTRLAF